MVQTEQRPISGHVFKRKGKRGAVWYAKYRLPDGRQQKKRLGPDWAEKTAPPDGSFTKATAQAQLDAILQQARAGTLPGLVQTGKIFREASAEWLAYCENVRDCKASTLNDYRNMVRVLDRDFGDRKIETITERDIETWVSSYPGLEPDAAEVPRLPRLDLQAGDEGLWPAAQPGRAGGATAGAQAAKIDVLRPEEVMALVRAAGDEQDSALFHAAAFAGLRMGELLALRWRDIDFTRRTIHVRENWTQGETTTPKGGVERAVPMADEVAERLARLGQREHFTADDDLVFCTEAGGHLGYKSLKDRYRAALRAAGLREDFRFHNLRHTFGSTVIRHADSREVMEWMGHADLATTRRYLAFVDREDAAQRVSQAFRLEEPDASSIPAGCA